jgi:hypothetical protein
MAILSRLFRNKQEKPWDVVTPFGGWNYPDPILSDDQWSAGHPPDDLYLKNLAYMASYGWHYYQKALVEMPAIHPLANYKPVIYDEFRETFDAQLDECGMPLLLYEREGKLISSNDWEAYWMYRERQVTAIPCIILGHFNPENKSIAICDRPFKIERTELLLKPHQAITTW